MTESATIQSLLAIEALGLTVAAGSKGLDGPVLWAHSCELPEPWVWLGPNELLMTVGLGIPKRAAEQVSFIQNLAQAGLAGLAIGEDLMCPAISQKMLDAADSMDFPVLMIPHRVPFVAVSRTVAAANSSTQTQQILTLNRLYRILVEQSDDASAFLPRLEDVFNVRMAVTDARTGAPILHGSLAAEGADGGEGVKVWAVPSTYPAVLHIREGSALMLDAFTSLHLRHAIAVAVDRVMVSRLGRINRGTQIMASVLMGQPIRMVDTATAAELGLEPTDWLALAMPADNDGDLQLVLAQAGIAQLSALSDGKLLAVVNAGDAAAACRLLLGNAKRIGVSTPFQDLHGIAAACKSAEWALGSIREGEERVAYHGDIELSLLPRSAEEARTVVEKVLGSICTNDDGDSVLLATLRCYLENDRNWAKTSDALGVHRQTLGYRLRRIEAETGRSFKSTRDLSELWIACSATAYL